MYTLVLMSALGSSPESADFNGYFRDLFSGRGSCRGSEVESSTSRDVSGCCGSCNGGLFHGLIRSWFHGGSCSGCCGGSGRAALPSRAGATCHGSSCNGQVAAAPYPGGGCTGHVYGSCTGSGYGSCTGSGYGSCFGSTGGYDSFPSMPSFPGGGSTFPGGTMPGGVPFDPAVPRATDSGYGGPSFYPPIQFGPPTFTVPPSGFDPVPFMPPATMPPTVGEERGSMSSSRFAPTEGRRGTVVVKLPPDAKLFAEGKPLAQSAGERKFVTPPLPIDREALYTFRVEYVRDGRTVSESQKVQVAAGKTATVEFADLTAARPGKASDLYATANPAKPAMPTIVPPGADKPLLPPVAEKPAVPNDRAKIVVKLPPGAVLFVDGEKNPRTDRVREFNTPPLQAGKEYAYMMRAEWKRDGQPESQEQRIEFKGGEQLTVDFTAGPNTQRASR